MRKSMRRKYKPFLQTDNSIEEIITITIVAVATPRITATNKNYVALYIRKKNTAYRNILRRNKKSLKLSLKISLKTAFRSE